MSRKFLFTSFILLLSLFLAVGCSKGEQTSGTNPGSADESQSGGEAQETIELVWSMGRDATPVSDNLIAAFEEKYPHIKIKKLELPQSTDAQYDDYVVKLSTGDTSIDIFNVDIIWPPAFGAAEWTLPLNDYFTEEELEAFLPGPVEGNTYNGVLYSIPFYTDAGVLYYRKDILEEAGVEPPETWEELIQLARELKGKGGTEYGFVYQANQYEGLVCNILEYMWSNGGAVLDENDRVVIDSTNNIEALEFLTELTQSDLVPSGITTYIEEDARTLFTEGKVVFMRNWPYAWGLAQSEESKVQGKVGIAPMPVGPSGEAPAATLGGWNLAINRNISDDKKEAAIKFLRFVTSPEGQKINALGGRLPVLKKTYEDPEVLEKNPHFEYLFDVFINGKPRPVSPSYSQISDVMQIQVHKAITGEISAEEAIKNMQAEIEKLLQ